MDALREPWITAVGGLPVPSSATCAMDEDDNPRAPDPWDGRVAILSPYHNRNRCVAG